MTNTTATPDVAGALVWFEHVITHGLQRIRAHLELSGDELHVHANSHARFERMLATIRALDPSVTVLREPANRRRRPSRPAAHSAQLGDTGHVHRPGRGPCDRCGPGRDGPHVRDGLARRADPRASRSHAARMRQRPDPPPRPDPATRLVPAGPRQTRHNEPRTPTRCARLELTTGASPRGGHSVSAAATVGGSTLTAVRLVVSRDAPTCGHLRRDPLGC